MLEVKCYQSREMGENTYFVYDTEQGISFVTDPGEPSEKLLEKIEMTDAEKLQYILLTHGHFDHIGYVAELKKLFPQAKIVIGEGDAPFTNNDALNASAYFGFHTEHFDADITVNDGDVLEFGEKQITVLFTPGHTQGGVCYRIEDIMFTGDTIMHGTFGRSDLPTGDSSQLYESLKKILAIPEDLTLYSGHGSKTTIAFEKKYNPIMRYSSYEDIY